ncbi:hypothetical protein J6590_014252 [Homalodisca vitripennis]|nr:hypothetical protein J6590_014252 [Homalodisca vitripennis]
MTSAQHTARHTERLTAAARLHRFLSTILGPSEEQERATKQSRFALSLEISHFFHFPKITSVGSTGSAETSEVAHLTKISRGPEDDLGHRSDDGLLLMIDIRPPFRSFSLSLATDRDSRHPPVSSCVLKSHTTRRLQHTSPRDRSERFVDSGTSDSEFLPTLTELEGRDRCTQSRACCVSKRDGGGQWVVMAGDRRQECESCYCRRILIASPSRIGRHTACQIVTSSLPRPTAQN